MPTTTLAEIESAVAALPRDQKYALYRFLEGQLLSSRDSQAPSPHGVLDIPPVELGPLLRPFTGDDDFLEEMLEGKA